VLGASNWVGLEVPDHCSAAGKVFLAWGPAVDGDDMERLAQQLATTRRRGWADSFGERAPGVASVSAPVFGPGDAVLAAISVSGPASRITALRAKAYAPAVMQAAREVESALGG